MELTLRFANSLKFLILLFLFATRVSAQNQADLKSTSDENVFRFHTTDDLESLDPIYSRVPVSAYASNLITAPLMVYQRGQLVPWGGNCNLESSGLIANCVLNSQLKWSDGKPILAKDYVFGFHFLMQQKSSHASDYLHVKNVLAKGPRILQFILSEPDYDFLYKLIPPLIIPRRENTEFDGHVTSGPYFVTEKKIQSYTRLQSNPHFFIKAARPEVEIRVVESDNAAINLFQTGRLNFLRRVNSENLPLFKNKEGQFKPGFKYQSLFRLDYIGFGPELSDYPELRKALIQSLQPVFKPFQKLFNSKGKPGCAGLFAHIMPSPVCILEKPFIPIEKQTRKIEKKLKMLYSTQGDSDLVRSMEFIQASWKKNLGIEVYLEGMDGRVLGDLLRTKTPALFRRSNGLSRPTCLAALENFTSGHPMNFIKLKDLKFDKLVGELKKNRSPSSNPSLCRKAFEYLFSLDLLIPMGEMHFATMSDQKFDGFSLNELNQLDASRLKPKGR